MNTISSIQPAADGVVPAGPTPTESPDAWWRGAGAVALAAAILGGIVGLHHCTWQAIVEPAQVLAGTVEYPPDNPYYHRHLQAWSLTSQLSAALLASGISEEAVSIAVSGLLGAAYSAAAALVAFALCRNFWLALVASVCVYYLFGQDMPYNSAYQIVLVGTVHSNGVLGQQMALLCVGLAGLGRPRLAGFCCAVAPAVHVTWGLWAIGVTGLALAWERPPLRRFLKEWGPGLVAGGIVTAASLGWQIWLARDVPAISAEEKTRYLRALLAMWDYHRSRRVLPFEPGMLLTAASVLFSAGWLFRFRDSLSKDAARLLRIFVITGALSYALAAVAPWLPEIVVRAIPARFITLSLLALPALLLGVLGIAAGDAGCRLLLAFHLFYLAGHRLVMPGVAWNVNETLTVGALGAVLCFANRAAPAIRRLRPWLAAACAAAFAIMATGVLRQSAQDGEFATIPGPRDEAIQSASQGSGMLIVAADLPLMQLKTRRPVLFFGWMLDDIVYFPNLAPASNRILQRVYEVDLLDPEQGRGSLHRGTLAPNAGPWERRSRQEWLEIGREYGATQVVTPRSWRLDLPVLAQSERYTLYAIAEGSATDVHSTGTSIVPLFRPHRIVSRANRDLSPA